MKITGYINTNYLKELRKNHKLSAEQLANKLRVSLSTYYKYECGYQTPSIFRLQLLNLIYKDVDYNKLLNIKNIKCYSEYLDNIGGKDND